MKTIQKLFVIVFTLVFIAGCSDELIPVQEYDDAKNQLKVEEVDNPVVESVTGSGQLERNYYEPDVWRTFSINAIKKADGTVKGTYQIHDHNLTFVRGKVQCFTIFDNKVVFLVTRDKFSSSVAPQPPYTYGYVVVEDNGQGLNAPPDRISFLYSTNNPDDCGNLWEEDGIFVLNEVESGNIMIHK